MNALFIKQKRYQDVEADIGAAADRPARDASSSRSDVAMMMPRAAKITTTMKRKRL